MTARQMVLDHARDWTEEQAELALQVVEGGQPATEEVLIKRHRAAMKRAAELRAKQTETFDAATAVRESREDLERRGS